jgi:hypothetical protein
MGNSLICHSSDKLEQEHMHLMDLIQLSNLVNIRRRIKERKVVTVCVKICSHYRFGCYIFNSLNIDSIINLYN